MFSPQSNRKIPVLMATQHPDNAGVPFWHNNAFISDQVENEEIYESFSKLGVDEYMWDWEGKFADEAIVEKLLAKYFDFFKEKQIGRDVFLTLRVPNIWEEKTFKLSRAYMSVLSAAEFTKSLGLYSPPVFELILPMTKSADQLVHIQETFKKTARLNQEIFGNMDFKDGYIHIIPLFESVDDLADSAVVLTQFIEQHEKVFGYKPPYMRIFIARSDPALNAGFPAAVLATRMALREFYRIGKKFEIPVYPIIGTGSLPFRGGVNPENIEKILAQYKGTKTITLQSAFRYDYPMDEVKKAIAYIESELQNVEPLEFSDEEFMQLRAINEIFKKYYCKMIEDTADVINDMAKFVPRRRERVQHLGLFGYNRGVGKTKLPRAITFTAAWYSYGIPPEFIGTGRGLKEIKERGLLPTLEKHFFTIRSELNHAGKYLNRENLEILAETHDWAKQILEDIRLCEEVLEVEIGPKKESHLIHRNLTPQSCTKKLWGKISVTSFWRPR
jgi:phosphoenolpyruvate carboxylase